MAAQSDSRFLDSPSLSLRLRFRMTTLSES